jgi:tetrahydromethanopterin S-methyltransferase subunit G
VGRIAAALGDLCDTLAAAGIDATIKSGEIQVPGAWVSARELAVQTLAGGWQITAHVWLIVPDAEEDTAQDALDDLLEKALAVLPVDTTNGDTVQLAGTLVVRDSGPLPAIQITTTIDV